MHNYFYCYSIKLKDWLKLSGLQYNQKIKTKSGKYCWLFERGEELDAALSGWEKYKQIFNCKEDVSGKTMEPTTAEIL